MMLLCMSALPCVHGHSGEAVALAEIREMEPLSIVLNVDHEILERSMDLIYATGIRGRDSVHAATALADGIETIASSDPAFDGIPGLKRVDPLAA